MRIVTSCLAILMLAASPALAQQETVVKEPSGERLKVRTDESGTTVSKEPAGAAAAPAAQPLESEHRAKVEELTKGGAKVESEKTGAAVR
ncbi:MAG: hypothetical protein K2X62_14860 [Beijerinckiaceae bacterium]|nr:hypothetical protein [Beijerinckiaceae bacterium]MBX9758897.1 hypothetical protein [Beijerinckiaceae bacterium]